MHINNIKSDNNVANLKWGTASENTKAAFNEGLISNDKGFNDSQSFPVCCFDLNTNLLGIYGSISQASIKLGTTKTTISL